MNFFEIFRQNNLRKFGHVIDDKAILISCPMDIFLAFIILPLQHWYLQDHL